MREPRVGLSEWLGRPGMLALGVVPFCKHRSRTARSVACFRQEASAPTPVQCSAESEASGARTRLPSSPLPLLGSRNNL